MDEPTRLRMRTAHARQAHTCRCGRTVHGNGGWASHRWACPTYQAALEARIAESGRIPDADLNVRRAPRWTWNGQRWDEHK